MTIYYRNETLFSEIYLEEITRQPEHEDALASLRVLREYRDYAGTSSLEMWTQSYVHEVLAALGFTAQKERTGLTLLHPIGSSDQPVSLCIVTLPGENLDETHMGRNWAEKTIRALRGHSMQWGLLTNGKLWRIYHLTEAMPYETYLEIDLEQILHDQAKDAYQIFHKFMKAGNFAAGNDGTCQFDHFKKESKDKIDYIEDELSNALKQREEGGKGVLSDLCMGYVEELRNAHRSPSAGKGVDLDDEIQRRRIYHGAMLYMFRLLFLFYAEARGLLSNENQTLLSEVEADANAIHNGEANQSSNYTLWERLSAIFVDIDQTYNGGLFSPQESEFTQFIEETRVANRYLAETLFNLITYREKNGEEHPISYRDMGVRHLGTLYEGLLEHRLFITSEATEVRVSKGKITFVPASRGGKLIQGHYLPADAVYFAGDPSERKSTGSYYTPEYIVDYIVRNTVGEKLKALKAGFMAQERANLEALARSVDDAERASIAGLLEENALAFVREKILRLSVLDPAMGSGHFLVNVTNLIANFITEFLNDLDIEGETPTGTAYWRRWVVENCIYGVDLNPLAVELAKLSLWILSMAKDQPLSFMNHHLKCGNSLVGARLDEIGNYPFSTAKKEPRQLKLFERDPNFRAAVEDALAKSRLIASRASTSLADVEEKKAWLAEIEDDLKGYKAICNVHTGLYFGNQVDETDYTRMVEKRDFARALVLENNNQYLHWELEFPEVFLDLRSHNWNENVGFDVVVGNPPYINVELVSREIKDVYAKIYKTFYMRYDVFGLFIEHGLQSVSQQGNVAFIIPAQVLNNLSFKKLRDLMLINRWLEEVCYLGDKVFESANNDVCILFLRKPMVNLIRLVNALDFDNQTKTEVPVNHFEKYSGIISVSANSTGEGIVEKIFSPACKPVRINFEVFQGIVTGNNDAYLLTADQAKKEKIESELLRPVLLGRDFEKWMFRSVERQILYVDGNVKLEEYPKAYSYLLKFKDAILATKGLDEKSTEWYSLHRPRERSKLDFIPKILVQGTRNPRLKTRIVATLDTLGVYGTQGVNFILPKNDSVSIKYLLAVLNSSLINYLFTTKFLNMAIKAEYLKDTPIPHATHSQQNEIDHLVTQVLDAKRNNPLVDTSELEEQIDRIVYELFGLTKEEIAVVEAEG